MKFCQLHLDIVGHACAIGEKNSINIVLSSILIYMYVHWKTRDTKHIPYQNVVQLDSMLFLRDGSVSEVGALMREF